MAVQLASTPLPPNVHVVYEVLCSEGPQTGRQLERLLEKRGVVVPANRLLELPRRFPGVFLIDEAERLAVPVACDRCGAHACDTCQRDVGAQPCALCGTMVCRNCRPGDAGLGDLCLDCATPVRAPEADLRYCRAWVLGADRRLLVGERSAMLFSGTSDPLVLVPDADRDDPVRRRLRALAAALRVPPETGLHWAGPALGPPAPGQFTARLEVREELAWEWLPDGGCRVDPEAADTLPQAEGPPVVAESEASLAGLLARLRTAAPPPPVGALEVTPLLDVAHTTVSAEGLERRHERHYPGGEVETLAVERSPLQPPGHPGGPPGGPPVEPPARPVATAELGQVIATLDAVHASYLLTTTSPEGRGSWFAAAAPGLTLGSEHTWGSVVLAAGLDAGTQVRRPKAAEGVREEDFAHPSQATLVERKVEQTWRLVRRVPDAGVAGLDELDLVGYEVVEVEEPPEAPAGLLETAVRLDPLAEAATATLGMCLAVEERWQGRGTAGRSYLVTPGSKPWPVLDDTGRPGADFGVDDAGHLHEPGAGWECPACRRVRCPACGPDGELGSCPQCRQPACQECLLHPPQHDEEQECERCGDRSCTACGRTLQAEPCRLCRRLACRTCLAAGMDGRCPTCTELRPASGQELEALPARLAPAGLKVLLATDGEWTVAALFGRHRLELAVLRADRLVRWETAQGDAPVLLRARIGAAGAAGGDVEIRQGETVSAPVPAISGLCLVLASVRQESLRWAVLDSGGRAVAGSGGPPEPSGSDSSTSVLARLVEGAGWAGTAIPEPAPGDVAEMLRKLSAKVGAAGPIAGGTLLLDPRRAVELTWLDADGLHRAWYDGRDARQVDTAWSLKDDPAWVADEWFPVPEVVLASSLEDVDAAVVRAGAHVALGLRDGEGTRWTTLRNRPSELAKLALAASLEEEDTLCEVVALTDPDTVRGPILVDGSIQQRVSTPVVEEQPGAPSDQLLKVALGRFAPTFQQVRPADSDGEPPSQELATALLVKVDQCEKETGFRRIRVGIGLQVDETWVQGGSTVRLRYELAAGEHEGMVLCEATGTLVTAVSRDREGHLVATTTTCRFCRTETCALCVAPSRPCAVCQILICGRCSSSPEPDYVPRCPACVRLRRLNWMERRRFHSLLAPGGRVLVGHDALHGVTLVESPAGWQLLLEEPGQELPSALVPGGTPRGRVIGRIADMA